MIYKLPASDLLIILFTCFVLCVWIDMHACACLIDCCWLRTTLARTTRLTRYHLSMNHTYALSQVGHTGWLTAHTYLTLTYHCNLESLAGRRQTAWLED